MQKAGNSKAVMARLPLYLQCLKGGTTTFGETVSSAAIARALELGEVQVRKDLAQISGAGRPRIGYVTKDLIRDLENALGCRTTVRAVILGAGKLGSALLHYDGFEKYGLSVIAAFDRDERKIGDSEGKPVLPVAGFADFYAAERPEIAILTVPESAADAACELVLGAGIRAIWNFSGRRLRVPEGVTVRNENLALSLAVLAGQLAADTTQNLSTKKENA